MVERSRHLRSRREVPCVRGRPGSPLGHDSWLAWRGRELAQSRDDEGNDVDSSPGSPASMASSTCRPCRRVPEEATERASSVLRTVRLARQLSRTGGMIGLTPEGQDNPGGFGHPPPGAGEFMALLVEAGLPILPAGNGQTGGHLRVRFGPVFTPHVPPRRENRDAAVAGQVMGAIARCLQ